MPYAGTYEEVFSSDRVEFGGSGVTNGKKRTKAEEMHGMEQIVDLKIPPLSVMYFKGKPRAKRRVKAEPAGDKAAKTTKKTATKKTTAKRTTKKASPRKSTKAEPESKG